MMELTFNSQRLTLAREARGLKKRELASLVSLSDKVVGEHEAGKRTISEKSARIYSEALQFPLSFFQGDDIEKLSSEMVNFRALSKMSVRNREKVLSGASIVVDLFDSWIRRAFTVPNPDIPDFFENASVGSEEELSFDLRLRWGLAEAPIKNMIHLMEYHGIRVYTLPDSSRESDAFSFWLDGVPYIFFDNNKTAERARFDIAHELGHLVMHKHLPTNHCRDLESEANRFASFFLMPKSAFWVTAKDCCTMSMIIQRKKYWNVSAMAFIYRLKSQGIISDWTARQFNKICSVQGKVNEPNPSPFESSQIFSKIMKILADQNKTLENVAREHHLEASFLKGFLFGMDTVCRYENLRFV